MSIYFDQISTNDRIGTYNYMSPELLNDSETYDNKVDILLVLKFILKQGGKV